MKAWMFSLGLLAAAGGVPDEWAQALRRLQEALGGRDEARLEQAVARVAADDSARAVEALVRAARSAPSPAYWTILVGMARVSSPAALAALGKEILEGKVPELRRDLILPLRLSEAPGAVELLKRILREGSPELQVSAMDELVDRERLDAGPLLLDLADRDPQEERELTRRVFKALRALAKEDPPAGGPPAWRRWWAQVEARAAGQPPPALPPRGVGQTVADSIRRTRVTDYEELKRGKKEEVLVIPGANDAIEDVLYRLSIPYTVVGRDQFEGSVTSRSAGINFSKFLAIFINCGTADWSPSNVEKIRKYVGEGGYLFLTDLATLSVARHAFPGYLDFGKGTLPDMTVNIVPWKGSTGHPYLRGVPVLAQQNLQGRLGGKTIWIIDSGGTTLGFDASKVVPLIQGIELQDRRKPPAVALTFTYGPDPKPFLESVKLGGLIEEFERSSGGKVLCVLGHFRKQPQGEDGFALENLLINFLIEAKDRAILREKRKK